MGDGEDSREPLAGDVAMISAVAVALVAVHLLVPPGVRAGFAFDHDALAPVTVFTSAFVHIDGQHLLGNVAGYVAATAVAYGLAVQTGRRRWFRHTFLGFLVVLPVLVSLTGYALLSWSFPGIDPVTQGFSGVGSGFVGLVFVAFLVGLRDEFGPRTAWYVGLSVWLLLLLEVYLIYSRALTPLVGGLVAVGWGLSLWGLLGEFDLARVEATVERGVLVGQLAMVVVLLVLFVWVLFPRRIVADGSVTNIFAHAAGLCYGVGGAALTHRVSGPARDGRRDR